ncbi:MAG: SGNH hydrolase domain-containing protein [Acidimicrobiales bacterium]
MLRRMVAFGLLTSVCLGAVTAASAAPRAQKSISAVESLVASAVKDSKAPSTYNPPLTDFVPGANLSGEGTLKGCDAYGSTKEIDDPLPCVDGNPHGTKVVVLVGDSNVGNWSPGLSLGLAKTQYKLDVFSFAGCPTSDIKYSSKDYIGTSPSSCNNWHQNVITEIKKLSPVAIVTASSGIGTQYDPTTWENGYNTLFLQGSGGRSSVKRIVIGTSPYFPTPPPTCLSLHPSTPLECLLMTSTSTIVGPYSTYAIRDAAVAKASKATLISTSSLFCYDGKCPSEVAGTVTFVDNDHVSTAYADKISGPLTSALLAALK